MEIFMLILGAFIVLSILVGLDKVKKEMKVEKNQAEQYKSLVKEMPDAKFALSQADTLFAAIDFKNEKMVVGHLDGHGPSIDHRHRRDYKFSDVIEVEIIKDGTTLVTTNRGSQAVGAAVGALAFGGVGAVIGGLSGSSTKKERIYQLVLRLKFDDTEWPVHDVIMFNCPHKEGVNKNDAIAKEALKKIEVFATHVANAMRRSAAPHSNNGTQEKGSVAADLKVLWDLKQQGALTDDEYNREKAKIMTPEIQTSSR